MRFTCSRCGTDAPLSMAATHAGEQLKGKYYCIYCVDTMCRATPDKKYTKHQRYKRLLKRLSRNTILSPQEVNDICWKCARSFRTYARHIEDDTSVVGCFNGEALHGVPTSIWKEFEQNKKTTGNSEINKTRKYMAILLILSGDKNGIKHC